MPDYYVRMGRLVLGGDIPRTADESDTGKEEDGSEDAVHDNLLYIIRVPSAAHEAHACHNKTNNTENCKHYTNDALFHEWEILLYQYL